jgi:hypothetical protein
MFRAPCSLTLRRVRPRLGSVLATLRSGQRRGRDAVTFPRAGAVVKPGKTGWTTGRVLLFTAFASSVAYVVGIADVGPRLVEQEQAEFPHYAGKTDMEKVVKFFFPSWKHLN